MSNPVKLFVVEGLDRDYRFVNEMTACFFGDGRFCAKIINLPASQNIYMLYQLLKSDDFETDLVELLRDTVSSAKDILEGVSRQDIDEVYLFFDYDIHQNNLSQDVEKTPDEVIQTLLAEFNNETENGKLYVSYPMVEALYDYKSLMCESFSGCYIPANQLVDYKRLAGNGNLKSSLRFGIEEWREVLAIFVLRIKCLFDLPDISYEDYRQEVTPASIHVREMNIRKQRDFVFVLSGFPEFILDYFKIDFWNSFTKLKRFNYEKCFKQRMNDNHTIS